MGQEKRVIIAFALSFAMLIVWKVFFVKEPPPPPKKPAATQTATTPAAPASSQPSSVAPTQAAPSAKPSKPPKRVELPVVQGTQAQDIVVEDSLYRVTFSTQGAVVKSWILKKYHDENRKPLDVVNGPACEKLGYPMSLSLPDDALAKQVNSALYVATPSGGTLSPPAKIEFTYSDGKVRVKKEFNFEPGYVFDAKVSVFDGTSDLPVGVEWPGGFGDHSLPLSAIDSLAEAVYGSPGDLTTVAQHKVSEVRTIPGPLQVAGLEDRYFAGIFLPALPDQVSFRFGRREWNPPEWKEKEKPKPLYAVLSDTQPQPLSFRMLVAPKDLQVLRSVNPPLDSLVDFGWFSIVAKPLFVALQYVYEHWVHNYGWAIVILTILINLAMFPLKLKSIRSAQEMQRISPLVKGIQDKYKQFKFNDPRKQKMNQEVMKLYQEHHINPFGSCIPMLLQLPFLYGFYRVLELPIELRHAPWILWIKDLSAPDNFHPFGIPVPILPTIMVITMFVLQKMTPIATADPSQKRMMLFMPLVFGIMFYRFASGLVLYFLTANIVGIAQQAFINKMMPLPDPLTAPTSRKPAEAKR